MAWRVSGSRARRGVFHNDVARVRISRSTGRVSSLARRMLASDPLTTSRGPSHGGSLRGKWRGRPYQPAVAQRGIVEGRNGSSLSHDESPYLRTRHGAACDGDMIRSVSHHLTARHRQTPRARRTRRPKVRSRHVLRPRGRAPRGQGGKDGGRRRAEARGVRAARRQGGSFGGTSSRAAFRLVSFPAERAVS